MKVVFMGTPEFAVPSLEAVLAAGDVMAVVTRPDRPRGRGLRVVSPALGVAAAAYALPVLQPASLRDPGILARLRELEPDIFIVVAYGRIIPPAVLAVAPLGGINLHPSLLPRYRGAAPIPRAIAAGETETGVTVFHLSDELDAGDIIHQRAVPIASDDTAATLEARLATEGAALLAESLPLLERGQAPRIPQDPSRATQAPKLTREEAAIRWAEPAAKIVNLVRALDPWPVAHTVAGATVLKIYRAAALRESGPEPPGTVIRAQKDGLVVAAGTDRVLILEVQASSGRRMRTEEYLRGHRISPGTVLGIGAPREPSGPRRLNPSQS